MKKYLLVGAITMPLLMPLLGCSMPEPVEEQIVDSNFNLADKSSDELLKICQQEVQERLKRPDSFEFIDGSTVFDKNVNDERYRVFFKFYADMTDPDEPSDPATNAEAKVELNGYCQFDEQGEAIGSGLGSI